MVFNVWNIVTSKSAILCAVSVLILDFIFLFGGQLHQMTMEMDPLF